MKNTINKAFEIGDKVLIKDGRGEGGEGWVYGVKKFGSIYLHKVFSIDYIYSLNNCKSSAKSGPIEVIS